jgi:DNA end-binding protein Ku
VPDIDTMDDGQDPVTRSFWSGTITFGLVSIPVALYAANRSTGVSLRMVAPDGTRLGRRYFTTKDDRELDPDEIVRGYEIEKDRFVLVDDDELERLAPERTRDIDLRQFVKVADIDLMYFERAYYLIPNGQSTKAYRLLAQVMEDTGRAGIATFVMRAKEYLVAIIAENGILRAETLRFADELRTPETVGLPEPAKPGTAAVQRMSREIGKHVGGSLAREDLADHSVDRLMKVVQRKLRAGDDVVPAEETGGGERDTDVIDLMEILKRRLQGESEAEIAADHDEAPRAARKAALRKTAAKKTASKRPAAKKAAAKKPASKTTASKRAASKTASKKTVSKTAAKKPASRKPAAKKRASRKAA